MRKIVIELLSDGLCSFVIIFQVYFMLLLQGWTNVNGKMVLCIRLTSSAQKL